MAAGASARHHGNSGVAAAQLAANGNGVAAAVMA